MAKKMQKPPPDNAAWQRTLAAMVRVNHAGEYGAVRIYQGQLALLGKARAAKKLAAATRSMAAQEERHEQWFAEELRARAIPPSALLPLWHGMGFALGVGTAFLGARAAHACTEAVEEVIDQHYRRQLEVLRARRSAKQERQLRAKIARAHKEELAHRDYARAEGAAEAPAYRLLHGIIKTGCRLAIAASSRI